tara:strand:- start:32224 stop:32493 length:270 start_codon:yes stop_codon:yes gene_type:complete
VVTIRIVAAALKRGDLVYSSPPPARHHTLLHEVDRQFGDKHLPFTPDEQGFLGSDGLFYGREAAARIAVLSEQCIEPQYGRQLFSEDLW